MSELDAELVRAIEEMTTVPIRAAVVSREPFRWPAGHLARAYVVEARNASRAARVSRDAELAARPPRPRAARRTRRRPR